MNITIKRHTPREHCTIGDLWIDGLWECFVLEDKVREIPGKPVSEWKVKGETAIPAGTYKVIINRSPRFNKDLPLLLKVPGFEGVRIHSGNSSSDTEGCILVGKRVVMDTVVESRLAFNAVFQAIQEAIEVGEEVTITLENS